MLEKWLFKKIELWVVAVLAVFGLIGCVLFGYVVNMVAQNHALGTDNEPSVIGKAAFEISSIPIYLKQLIQSPPTWSDERVVNIENINAYDFLTKSSVRMFPLEEYQPMLPEGTKAENPPVIWSLKNVAFPPLAVLVRTNDQKDEQLVILDASRQAVRVFPIKVTSMDEERPALLGASETTLLDDASMIVFPIGGKGLYRQDLCGKVRWSVKGIFHHNYSVVDGKLYILGLIKDDFDGTEYRYWNEVAVINEIDVETGKVLRSVSLDEISRINMPKFDPMFHERWADHEHEPNYRKHDFLHINKIDVLSKAMAPEYPGFPAGAWLVSLRNLNLIMVIDPATLEILWFDHAHVQVQHDPQFVGKNKIVVFNNASRQNDLKDPEAKVNFSSLREYDFGTRQWREVFDGKKFKAFSFHMGNFDVSPRGGYLVNVSTQGRYLEVTDKGDLLTAIVNIRDPESVYWTKHAQYLTPAQFDLVKGQTCH